MATLTQAVKSFNCRQEGNFYTTTNPSTHSHAYNAANVNIILNNTMNNVDNVRINYVASLPPPPPMHAPMLHHPKPHVDHKALRTVIEELYAPNLH